MISNPSLQNKKQSRSSSITTGKAFPFSLKFDTEGSNTKLDVVLKNSEGPLNSTNVVSATMILKFIFKETRRARLPFIQSGTMALMDATGVLDEKTISGFADGIQFRFNTGFELVQQLIQSDNSLNNTLLFNYSFRSYDVWEKETRLFSDSVPVFTKLKEVLAQHTQYYYIGGEEEPRLTRFEPKFIKERNLRGSKPAKQIVHVRQSKSGKNTPLVGNFISAPLLAHSLKPTTSAIAMISPALWNFDKLGNLPRVDDLAAAHWPDYTDKNQIWVKPSYELKLPNPGMSYGSSPFHFTVRNIGVMADGSPALEADLLITVRLYLDKNRINSLDKKMKTHLLKITKSQYKIRLPYIDGNGNQNTTYLNPSETISTGEFIKLNFQIANNWVRLLYGALSTPNMPNASRPNLMITYHFDAMQQKRENITYFVNGFHLGTSLQLASLNKLGTLATPTAFSLSKSKVQKPNTPLKRRNRSYGKTVASKTKGPIVSNTMATAALVTANPQISHTAVANNLGLNTALINREKKKEYIRQSLQLSHSLDLSVACTAYGDYYSEFKANTYEAIGCSEPMRLGQIRTPLYLRMEELEHARYSVYKSQVMPQLFLIVPKKYVLSRKSEDPEKFAPELMLLGAVDVENIAAGRCAVDLKLVPELTYYERLQLEGQLKNFTAYTPQITYITEIGGEESFHWNLSNSIIDEANAFAVESTIVAVLETSIMNAQLCKTLLETSGISGIYRKLLAPGLEVSTQMSVSLDEIAQPWSGEGVDIEQVSGILRIHNRLESSVYVDRLVQLEPIGETEVPVQQHIAAGATIDIESQQTEMDYIAVFSIRTDKMALSESYTYIEDLFQQIICFDLFSSEENGTLLEVQVGCQDKIPYTQLDFSDGSAQKESHLLIPISEIISSERFGYYVKYSVPDGSLYETEWIPHDFSSIGNIINITKNKII